MMDLNHRSNLIPKSGDSQPLTQSCATNRQMVHLHQLIISTNIFWHAIIYFFLITITLTTFIQQPHLLSEPRGWGIILLAITLAFWYHFGCLWMMNGNSASYYTRLDNGELPRIHWRGFIYWSSMLGVVIALSVLNHNFVWMFWAVYGLNFAIFPFPQVFVTLIPTIVIIIVANGWLPSEAPPVGILNFVGELGALTIYSIIAYLPYMLIKARARREQVFADLERSHQALELAHTRLEDAHQQLAEAGERDREIAVLRERGRLARDMHDTLGHSLVLANVKLEAALRLRAIDPGRADHEIVATQQILRDSMADLRASLANLRSPLLPQEPLGDVLTRTAKEAGARVTWDVYTDIAPTVGELDERTYEALLRIGGEAITNAERHASARTLWLRLEREKQAETDTVVLRVSDDGVGIFSTCPISRSAAATPETAATHTGNLAMITLPVETAIPAGHYGILGMHERVTALGGQLLVTSQSGTGGTTVEAHLPIPAFR